MPKQYSKQELDSHYNQLPEVLKDAMFSADVAEKIYQIGERLSFTEIQISAMAEEAGYLILGVVEPKDFVGQLAERVGINEEAARSAARELNTQIFSPLREALKTAHPEKNSEAEPPPIQTQTPQPAPSRPMQYPAQAPAVSATPPQPSPRPVTPPPPPPQPAQFTPPRPPSVQPAPPPHIATQESEPAFNQSIDLRRKEIEEMEPPRPAYQPTQPPPQPQRPSPTQPTQQPQRPVYYPQPAASIPPQGPIQQAPRFAPNPLPPETPPSKIPPIDLRQGIAPQPPHQGPHPLMTKPPVPPRAPGEDPYREPAQ